MAKNEALAVLHATLDHRRVIDVPGYQRIQLDDAARFIGTMNYGYAGTRELNEALVSRFVVVDMPVISDENLQKLLRRSFPTLKREWAEQLTALFRDLRQQVRQRRDIHQGAGPAGTAGGPAPDREGDPLRAGAGPGHHQQGLRALRAPAGGGRGVGAPAQGRRPGTSCSTDMDRQDRETRRAENQVWNGWGDYARKPELLTFDRAGDAELYGNTVLGLACRYYDFDRFRPLLNEFHRSAQEALYTDIFFLVLEGAVFARGAAERPLLPALRRDYARRLLAQTPVAEGMNGDAVRRAWACRVLEQPEDPALSPLLDELAAPGDSTEAQLIQRTERVLYTWFRRARRAADDRQWAAWVGRKRDKSGGVHFVRPNALRALSHDAPGGSGGLQKQTLFSFLQGRTPEPILRRYVEDCFGASMLTPGQLSEAERTLCTGVHKNCRLHFTRGEPVGRAPAPEAAWDAAHFRQQREKNRAYYREHLVENKLAIAQLTQKLQNTLLLRAEDEGGTGRAGRLRPELAWRAGALGDERVFSRRSPQEPGELSVDLLLDGSASQNRQQEKLATQAYLIAESLSRCRIPVRVTAFCSVSGCTVLRVLRDYDHPEQNEGVFDYVAAGWNRDGLALRAMGWLLRQRRSEQSLLLVLSDASPNDDQRIPNGLGGWAYTGKRGVDDTAAEAAALRLRGVLPVCLFTGSDREVPDARRIYGQAMERLPAIGWLADAVTRLIRGQLRRG